MVIGVAALFLPKTLPDQHWSDPPTITLVVAHDQQPDPGGPPRP